MWKLRVRRFLVVAAFFLLVAAAIAIVILAPQDSMIASAGIGILASGFVAFLIRILFALEHGRRFDEQQAVLSQHGEQLAARMLGPEDLCAIAADMHNKHGIEPRLTLIKLMTQARAMMTSSEPETQAQGRRALAAQLEIGEVSAEDYLAGLGTKCVPLYWDAVTYRGDRPLDLTVPRCGSLLLTPAFLYWLHDPAADKGLAEGLDTLLKKIPGASLAAEALDGLIKVYLKPFSARRIDRMRKLLRDSHSLAIPISRLESAIETITFSPAGCLCLSFTDDKGDRRRIWLANVLGQSILDPQADERSRRAWARSWLARLELVSLQSLSSTRGITRSRQITTRLIRPIDAPLPYHYRTPGDRRRSRFNWTVYAGLLFTSLAVFIYGVAIERGGGTFQVGFAGAALMLFALFTPVHFLFAVAKWLGAPSWQTLYQHVENGNALEDLDLERFRTKLRLRESLTRALGKPQSEAALAKCFSEIRTVIGTPPIVSRMVAGAHLLGLAAWGVPRRHKLALAIGARRTRYLPPTARSDIEALDPDETLFVVDERAQARTSDPIGPSGPVLVLLSAHFLHVFSRPENFVHELTTDQTWPRVTATIREALCELADEGSSISIPLKSIHSVRLSMRNDASTHVDQAEPDFEVRVFYDCPVNKIVREVSCRFSAASATTKDAQFQVIWMGRIQIAAAAAGNILEWSEVEPSASRITLGGNRKSVH